LFASKIEISSICNTTPVVEEDKSELKGYETPKATIRFPLDKKLPVMLIKKLIKVRVKKNDETEKKK
jgi:uncharacterized protein YdhG (YjbR/CyaY superfamily)